MGTLSHTASRRMRPFAPIFRTTAAIVLGLTTFATAEPVYAQSAANKVYGTGVDQGKFELGARGGLDIDDDPDKDGKHKHKFSIGYAPTGYWWTELIAELEQEGEEGANFIYEATEWENRFEFLEETDRRPGLGLYTAIVFPVKDGKAYKVEWRGLIQKRIGDWRHRFNLGFEAEFGDNRPDGSGVELGYAWQTKWYVFDDLAPGVALQPGFEAYGEFGEIGDFASGADQKHQIGPILFSEFDLGEYGEFELQFGPMFGLTRASADITFKWMAEYILHF